MANPPVADVDKLITVIVNSSSFSLQIPKSILIRESGFFATLFRGSWQEAESGVVTLRDDHVRAMILVLTALKGVNDDLDFARDIRALSVGLIDRFPVWIPTQEAYNIVVGMYLIADKYDIPVLRKVLAEFTLVTMFEPSSDRFMASSQPEFVALVYERLSAALGEYPADLFDLVCVGATHFLGKDGNADYIIEHISSNPRLLKHLIQYLFNRTPDNPQSLVDLAKQAAVSFRAGASAGEGNNGDGHKLNDEDGNNVD
jgi:hypothetical protein